MILDEFITALVETREKHGGDILVFVNGEYGEASPEMAAKSHISVGEAEFTLGGDSDGTPFGVRPRDKIIQIGGY